MTDWMIRGIDAMNEADTIKQARKEAGVGLEHESAFMAGWYARSHAARGDAERLAGALRRAETFLSALSPDENHPVSETRDAVRAALAAHEAAL